MSTFAVTARVDERLVRLEWQNGAIAGDPGAVSVIDAYLKERHVIAMTPTGPTVAAALTPDWVAFRTIAACLADVSLVAGHLSEPPYVTRAYPPGTVF